MYCAGNKQYLGQPVFVSVNFSAFIGIVIDSIDNVGQSDDNATFTGVFDIDGCVGKLRHASQLVASNNNMKAHKHQRLVKPPSRPTLDLSHTHAQHTATHGELR